MEKEKDYTKQKNDKVQSDRYHDIQCIPKPWQVSEPPRKVTTDNSQSICGTGRAPCHIFTCTLFKMICTFHTHISIKHMNEHKCKVPCNCLATLEAR